MLQSLKNIYRLGIKEIISLCRDWLMLVLILYSFTVAIVVASRAQPDSLNKAAIAIVDEDRSQLTRRLTDAFLPPMFLPPKQISQHEIDKTMDQGRNTFVVVFPPNFEKDVKAGNKPEVQINVDATRMTQAFTGSGYIQQIIQKELNTFLNQASAGQEARYVVRNRFNPNLTQAWFTSVMQLVNNITMLAIILTGAALIRERENGTLEHLLVMPVRTFEIMAAKIWSMMAVVLVASVLLFLSGVALHLFAATSLGIFLACISRNMPQLGMLLILVFLPMQMLSGGSTPRESMPVWVQNVMLAAPTTHFVEFSQAILYRGAGLNVVWRPFLILFVTGVILFFISLLRFRKSVA